MSHLRFGCVFLAACYTVCDNITLTFRSVSTQGSNRPTNRPFRSVPFLHKGRTVLRIVRSFCSVSTQGSNRPTDRPFRLSIVL